MRGGTSKGPFFNASDLPSDPAERDAVLLRLMGSPDSRQIDGLGGASTTTSKVAIVSPSDHDWAQVDYLFAQVEIETARVDISPTCGNMMAAVGPYAIEQGLVKPQSPQTTVRIRNVNTDSLIEAVIQTPRGVVEYDGDAAISGVPGTAAPVTLRFMEIVGSKTGKLLPTGSARDTIGGVDVSCVDVAMPMVILRAADLGKTGSERPEELHGDREFMKRLEDIRLEAGRLMGFGDVSESVIPKVGIVAPAADGGNVASRYFTPAKCHPSYAVSGAICVSTVCAMPGTVGAEVVRTGGGFPRTAVVEHPSGSIQVGLEFENDDPTRLLSGTILRTARKLFAGEVYIPASIWGGGRPATPMDTIIEG